MTRERVATIVALIIVIGIWTMSLKVAGEAETVTYAPAPAPGYVAEDDPRWDCRVMGDMRCGPDSRARAGGGYW